MSPTPISNQAEEADSTMNSATGRIGSDIIMSGANTTLPAPYMTSQDWPASIDTSTASYACNPSTSEMGETIEKVINDHTYCVTVSSEGATGSIYTTYTYVTPQAQGSRSTMFTLRTSNCGNYDADQISQCQNDIAGFDIDAAVDSFFF
ncbi:hypothetical protein H6776_00155 [Candidatus Nomurabacteria bacterium]|nr:hypothetical protein [Candidatus Nomurabacteria bacterium]